MRKMKLHKALGITAAVLGVAFAGQVAVRYFGQKPGPVYMASWRFSPKSMAEAVNLSKSVVEGRVTSVRRAPDLVVQAPGEPNNQDRIPQEVVTFAVERAYKGAGTGTVHVYQTGRSVGVSPIGRPAPTGAAPPRPAQLKRDAIPRPARIPVATTSMASTVMLENAPAYRVGERYVLFLTDGPRLTVQGAAVQTQAVISPEGRYRIGADNKIQPISQRAFADRAFAAGLRGQTHTSFLGALQKVPGLKVPTPQMPQPQMPRPQMPQMPKPPGQ